MTPDEIERLLMAIMAHLSIEHRIELRGAPTDVILRFVVPLARGAVSPKQAAEAWERCCDLALATARGEISLAQGDTLMTELGQRHRGASRKAN
jgi:hypothetical protein